MKMLDYEGALSSDMALSWIKACQTINRLRTSNSPQFVKARVGDLMFSHSKVVSSELYRNQGRKFAQRSCDCLGAGDGQVV